MYLNIKELLKKKNKTKYWLMKEMETDFQSVTNMIENKTKGIKFETLEKLCNALDCTPNDIIKRK